MKTIDSYITEKLKINKDVIKQADLHTNIGKDEWLHYVESKGINCNFVSKSLRMYCDDVAFFDFLTFDDVLDPNDYYWDGKQSTHDLILYIKRPFREERINIDEFDHDDKYKLLYTKYNADVLMNHLLDKE